MTIPANTREAPRRSGRTPDLLQDDCRALSKWLANKPGARRLALEAAADIKQKDAANGK